MKLFRMIGHSIRDAFKSLIRNFSLTLASASCIVITLIIVSISMILSTNVNNFAETIKKDVTVIVFLDRDVTESNTAIIQNKIRDLNNVESFKYSSKQFNLDEMKASSTDLANVMGSWEEEENPLQATISVKVKDVTSINETAEQIKSYKGVALVKYGEGMVEKLISTFKVVENVAYGFVIALILVSAFLIGNTIKLTIASRKKEIEIMRLVGASNVAIKMPFIIEGIFIGVIGSIIPIAVTIYGYSWLYDNFDGQLFSQFIKLVDPIPYVFGLSLLLLIIAVLVSMLGSGRAVRRYLKI